MSNLATVQSIYEAFGRGDLDSILDKMAPDVRWEHHPTGNSAQDHGVPYMRPRSGHDGVVSFFETVAADFEMTLFRPHTFLEGDGYVATVIEYELTIGHTGATIHDEEIHLWGFGPDGRISSYRHFLDTAKAIAARA